MAFNFQRLEHVRIGLALVAAVITGGAALYGVYHNAREATAASYETLAPEINDLKRAVTRLQEENQELRGALATARPGPAVERALPEARAARRPRPERAPRDAPPPATPAESPPGTPPAGTPPSQPPPAQPPAGEQPAEQPPSGVEDEIRKRVPIDFEKAREVWRQVKKLPR